MDFYSNMTQICMALWEFNWYPEHDFHSPILRRANINWGLKMGPIRWSIQGETLRLCEGGPRTLELGYS